MPKQHYDKVRHSSKRSNWRTPPHMFEALKREFNFDVDVAADENNHLCECWFGPGSVEPDGLVANWRSLTCFMNPPYAKKDRLIVDPWAEKAWRASQLGATVVGVMPHNPQTKWYRRYVYGMTDDETGWRGHAAVEVRQLSHRVGFLLPDGSKAWDAGGNTAVIIWRPNYGYIGVFEPMVRYWSYRP